MIPRNEKGQALVEAAIVLTLLCLMFMLVIGLDMREARSFRMALLARKAAWEPLEDYTQSEFRVDHFGAQSEISQPSAWEEDFRSGIMRQVRGGALTQPDLICSRVKGLGLKSVAEFGYEMGFITLPAPDPEYVALAVDNWDSPDDAEQTRQKMLPLVGQRVMHGQYRALTSPVQAPVGSVQNPTPVRPRRPRSFLGNLFR